MALSVGNVAHQTPSGWTGTADVAARIPGATIVALRGQGHQAIDYDPLQFVRAVVDFDASEAL